MVAYVYTAYFTYQFLGKLKGDGIQHPLPPPGPDGIENSPERVKFTMSCLTT